MSLQRGRDWGTPGALPLDGVVVKTDAQVRELVESARRAGRPIPTVGLLGGDLCRTLGGIGDQQRLHSEAARTFPIDVGAVLIDGRLHWFVAHLVARRSWWRGRVVVAMNAQWFRSYDLGPQAHPGDGLLDVSDGNPSLRERLQVRKRARTGTHLPHPAINTTRTSAIQFDFAPKVDVYLDGTRVARNVRVLSLRVEPAALRVVV
ncbi:MAG: hypothetical protein N2037_06165 [Acidimicrobiales bacterium]|nr:hypothetical protein [Acidimicrobiales bacterium]